MEAKEKAQDLVRDFYSLFPMNDYSHAKQCALIAVNELIKQFEAIDDIQGWYWDYWDAVKQEIKKL